MDGTATTSWKTVVWSAATILWIVLWCFGGDAEAKAQDAAGLSAPPAPAAQAPVVVVVPQGYDVRELPPEPPQAPQSTLPPPTALPTPPATVLPAPTLGERPPSHAEPRTRANVKLIVAGSVTLGASYVANLLGSALLASFKSFSNPNADDYATASLIPIAGPWVQLAWVDEAWEGALLIAGGLAQAAGLAMLIGGIVTRTPVDTTIALGDAPDAPTVEVTPVFGGNVAGVTATLRHF